MKKLLIVLGVIVLVGVGSFLFVDAGSSKSFDEEFPVTEITITADSAMIAHGRYLTYGPAHCAHCHSSIDNLPALEAGEEVDMTGGFEFELPIGSIFTPNITPDKETGIGNHSDGELYRMLRHNVRKDGQVCIDFMPFFNMSDYDIKSIIAYIKTRPAVKNERQENQYNFLGKVVRTLVLQPSMPAGEPLEHIEKQNSLEYGKYLSEAVANCMGCHTERDLKTGEYVGEPYAGGLQLGPDKATQGWIFRTPNITPDQTTGIMANWSEEQFISRMRGGRVHMTSPMPWGPFSRLEDDDLKAIYAYLQTVDPVARVIENIVQAPED